MMSDCVTIGDATLYHGDCLEILPTLSKGNAVITDPPYGFGAYATDNDMGVAALLTPFEQKAVFGYPETLCRWAAVWGEPREWVTWWATNKQSARTAGLSRESEAVAIYGQLYELPTRARSDDAMTLRIHKSRGNNIERCKEGDVWRDPSPGVGFNNHLRNHPNEKPIKLIDRLVRMCAPANKCVLDPFMGSGTTGVACMQLGRKFIGIEIERKYFDIACERIWNAQRQAKLFETPTVTENEPLETPTPHIVDGDERKIS